jgi:hypothetical protein
MGKRPYLGKSIGVIPYKLPSYRGEALKEKLREMKTNAGFAFKTEPPATELHIPPSAEKSIFERLLSIFKN